LVVLMKSLVFAIYRMAHLWLVVVYMGVVA